MDINLVTLCKMFFNKELLKKEFDNSEKTRNKVKQKVVTFAEGQNVRVSNKIHILSDNKHIQYLPKYSRKKSNKVECWFIKGIVHVNKLNHCCVEILENLCDEHEELKAGTKWNIDKRVLKKQN